MLQFPICYKVLYNRSRFLTKLTFHRQFNFAPTIPFLFVGGRPLWRILFIFSIKDQLYPFTRIFKNRQQLQCNTMHTVLLCTLHIITLYHITLSHLLHSTLNWALKFTDGPPMCVHWTVNTVHYISLFKPHLLMHLTGLWSTGLQLGKDQQLEKEEQPSTMQKDR